MRIVLFRHAPAEERDSQRWPDDLLRPLTSRGERRARRAARGIARMEPGLVRVFTSPALRAHATAEALASALGVEHEIKELDSLAPGGAWRETLRALSHESAEEGVALVGHEPELGKLAGVLVFGVAASLPLKKAGACSIEADPKAPGTSQLRWLLSADALTALSRARSRA